jgi:hypothetical protein
VARLLDPISDQARDRLISSASRRKAGRYLTAGRRALRWEGVLPWFVFEEGKFPENWSATPAFVHGLEVWHESYVIAYDAQIRQYEKILELAREYSATSDEALKRSQAHIKEIPGIQLEKLRRRAQTPRF